MDYNEKVKELNTLLRIFDSTIIALALGVIAYSFNNYNPKRNYDYLLLLYISWSSLSISFFAGLLRFHHLIKVYTRNALEQFEVDVKKKQVIINEERIRSTNKKSAWIYRIMISSFCLGIICYGLFKISNLS